MSAAEKRSVATDALETLGTHPIPDNSGRDAIHLAVEPVIAAETLLPGQSIGLVDGAATSKAAMMLGIVDPFLSSPVAKGHRFWLVVYPRQITSLRHVWSHPAFPEDGCGGCSSGVSGALTEIEASERWLRSYAEQIDEGFGTLIEAADAWVEGGEYFYGARTGDYYGKFEGESTHPDFWKHYQIYRGKSVPEGKQHPFFTCSC